MAPSNQALSTLSERDFARVAANTGRNRIDRDTIPTFVLGTIINVIDSTYSNIPIFNLQLLDKASLLDLNAQSASEDDLAITMTSNKNATSTSSTFAAEASASANFGGLIGASASAKYGHAQSLANSDGNVYVSMGRGKHGSYYQINTQDLASGIDFTPYLNGNELTDDEIKQYVDYEQVTVKQKTYISKLRFGGADGSGLIAWSEQNYYGNIRLITEMERIFALLREQYDRFEKEASIQNIIYTNMIIAKEKIGDAVKDFYAHVGTHFVSKLEFANYASGYGTLQFDETSSNEQSSYGAAVSLNGGIPSKFSGSAGASVSYARSNGWSQAMSGLHVEAHSRPSGVVSVDGFADEIMKMLTDNSKPLNVPNLTMPPSPKVTLGKVPELKKKRSTSPPESVFSSYADWKEYQADKKKAAKTDEGVRTAEQQVKEEGLKSLEASPKKTPLPNRKLYREFVRRLGSRPSEHKRSYGVDGEGRSNILRIDDMYVNGFETTPYESVIPSLRTNKIVLPKRTGEAGNYPNAYKLIMVINLFSQLADYVGFVSKFSVSNISADFCSAVLTFVDSFTDKSYEKIAAHMSAGKDIDAELLSDFAHAMYGDAEGAGGAEASELYRFLGRDIDRYNHVKYLLRPDIASLWRDAPGGYAPFYFGADSSIRFAGLNRIGTLFADSPSTQKQQAYKSKMEFDLTMRVDDLPNDIGKLYEGRAESPFYPIFRYENKLEPKFLFMQCAGKAQIIYSRSGIIHPFWKYEGLIFDRFVPLKNGDIGTDRIEPMDASIVDALMGTIEGFGLDEINRDYALYFPNKTQTKELRERSRVLQLRTSPFKDFVVRYGSYHNTFEGSMGYGWGYAYHDVWSLVVEDNLGNSSGSVVKVADGAQLRVTGFPVLLPIDYTRISGGYGSMVMGRSFGAHDVIQSPTLDSAIVTSMNR